MRKWSLINVISFSLMGLCAHALAASSNNILPTNDTLGCTRLIQQGDVTPPVPTTDLTTLQNCMQNCDILYKALGEKGQTAEMIYGTNYCRKSLSNLYFASVSQTISSQLDQQTQQQQANQQQSLQDKLASIIKQQQQQTQSTAGATQTDEADDTNKATGSAPANPKPITFPDNVKW